VFFRVTCKLYQNATTVMNGADTVTIYANSLKFDVNITGWPAFAAASNTLNYQIDISSKGKSTGGKVEDKGTKKKAIVVDNGVMDTPTTATVDGVANTAIAVTLTSKNNQDSVAFAFPRFTQSVIYDPVMCLGTCDQASGSVVGSVPSFILMLAAVALAAIGANVAK